MGVTVPLLLRGTAAVASWAPHGFATPAPDLYARIAELNRDDRLTGPAITEGLRERGFATEVMTADGARDEASRRERYAFPALAEAAGELLAAPDGPRIAAMEVERLGHPRGPGAAAGAAAAASSTPGWGR